MKNFLPKSLMVAIAFVMVNLFFTDITRADSNTEIGAAASVNGAWSALVAGVYTWTPSANNAKILFSEIQNRLTGTGFTAGSVTILTAGGGSQPGNVTITNALTAATTSTTQLTFTITAGGNISVGSAINFTAASPGGNNNGLPGTHIVLTAGAANTVSISANITNSGGPASGSGNRPGGPGGNITLTGASGISISANLTSVGGAPVGSGATGASGTLNVNDGNTSIGGGNAGQTSGVISLGLFNKSGAGKLMLSGNNTYTGVTTISAGVLNIRHANALGSTSTETIILANTAVEIENNINTPERFTVSGTGISNTGAIRNISGNNTCSGNLTTSTNRINSDAGTLTISGNIGLSGLILTFGGASNITCSGILSSASGGLIKDGAGILTLTNTANSYTGTTTVTAGELRLNPTAVAATFASQVVLNGGLLSSTNINANTIWTNSSTLNLNATSTMNLGSAVHSLKFAASNGVTWSGTLLTISGWQGAYNGTGGTNGKLFVGTNASGLTVAQLAKIKFLSPSSVLHDATILSTGEVVPLCTAPTFTTCPGNTVTTTASGVCSAVVTYTATATGTPAPTVTYVFTGATTGSGSGTGSGSTFNRGVTTVTITAANGCGANATCSFTVTVNDNTPPTAVCQNVTLQLDANGNASLQPSPLVFYNYSCDRNTLVFANVSQTFVAPYTGFIKVVNAGIGVFGSPHNYGTIISSPSNTVDYGVLTYSGRCCYSLCAPGNNMASLTLPTPFHVTAGQSITISFYGSGGDMHYQDGILRMYITGETEAAQALDGGSSDACGIAGFSASQTSFDCSDVGPNTVTLTVTDNNGNTSTCNSTVTVEDNLFPVITPGSIGTCYPTTAAAQAAALAATTATDNCPGVTFGATTVGTCSAVVTVSATDASGNTSTTAYNTRIDDTDPVITPGSINDCYATAEDAEAAALTATSATDNCDGDITYDASTEGTCSAVVTVTATDGCGNESSTTYNTRIDNTAPEITTRTIDDCYATTEDAEAAALAATSATDDCDGDITYDASTEGTCSAVVTVTATDGCGNESSTTYNTRIDNTAPEITAGSIDDCYATAEDAEAAALAATSATDDCDGDINYDASTEGTCSAVVTITATDGCGNESSTTYNTRIDNTAPEITTGSIDDCYATVEDAEAAALAATSATDDCDGDINYDASTEGTCSAVVTVTATDGCGNESSTTYNTRIDNTAPEITTGSIDDCYATADDAEAAALAATSATDDCDGDITYDASTEGTCSAVVTVTATDGCGNESSTTYNTRIDNTAPEITTGSIDDCYATADDAEAAALAATSATDDCDGDISYDASTEGTCSAVVTVTATDGCGNESSTTYNTRIDNTAPEITTGSIDDCYATADDAEAAALAATSATDDCDGDITYDASTEGTCNAVVTVTATDGCGNESSTTYNTRIDNTAPEITTGSIDDCYATADDAEAAALAATSATDDCDGDITYDASTEGTCNAVVTVTATDGCGNESSTTYNTRIDNTAPEITTGSIDDCYATADDAEAAALAATSATDDCDGDITYDASTEGTCSAVVTVTATDGCGNESSTTYNTRVDNTAPSIDADAEDANVECDGSGNAAELAAWLEDHGGAEASDGCGDVTWDDDFTSLSDDCGATGSATVTFSATDDCGNTSYTTATFTIVDTTAPVLSGEGADGTVECPNEPSFTAPTVSDACDDSVEIDYSDETTDGDCPQEYSITRTWTATDCAGNPAESVSQTITVTDNTAPVAQCDELVVLVLVDECVSTTAEDVNNNSYDACGGDVSLSIDEDTWCDQGVYSTTLTVTDECGNESTCETTVAVIIPEWLCGHNGDKFLVCHVTGNGSMFTLCVNAEDLAIHLAHGDNLGPCPSSYAVDVEDISYYEDHEINGHVAIDPSVEGAESTNHNVTSIPNPFNNQTNIQFGLNETEHVSLRIFDNMGQLVTTLFDGTLEAGNHAYIFDAANHAAGLYFFSLTTGKQVESGRMMLVR